MFANRQQAGSVLANRLSYSLNGDENEKIVLALPRGGVPVALEIALALNCPLNVLASKKIGAPQQKELAVGAVTSCGIVLVDEKLIDFLSISPIYLKKETEYLINKTRILEQCWRRSAGIDEVLDISNKTVIVVDDGVATGMTTIAAGRSLKEKGAKNVILATPVIAANTLKNLLSEYDKVIAAEVPEDFKAVGQFYADFRQVEDNEVVKALTQAMNKSYVKSL